MVWKQPKLFVNIDSFWVFPIRCICSIRFWNSDILIHIGKRVNDWNRQTSEIPSLFVYYLPMFPTLYVFLVLQIKIEHSQLPSSRIWHRWRQNAPYGLKGLFWRKELTLWSASFDCLLFWPLCFAKFFINLTRCQPSACISLGPRVCSRAHTTHTHIRVRAHLCIPQAYRVRC